MMGVLTKIRVSFIVEFDFNRLVIGWMYYLSRYFLLVIMIVWAILQVTIIYCLIINEAHSMSKQQTFIIGVID